MARFSLREILALKLNDADTALASGRLVGHAQPVYSVCSYEGGALALSGSADGTMRIWDVESASSLLTLQVGVIYCVHATLDSTRVLAAGDNCLIHVFSLVNGRLLGVLNGHRGAVYAVRDLHGGMRALSGSSDNTLRLWDLVRYTPLATLKGHADSIFALQLYANDACAVTGSYDSRLRLWDVEGGKPLLMTNGQPAVMAGHSGAVYAVCAFEYNDASWRALSGSYDCTIRLWDLASCTVLRKLTGHTSSIFSVCVFCDGPRWCALSASADATICMWDLHDTTGTRFRQLHGHASAVYSARILPVKCGGLCGPTLNSESQALPPRKQSILSGSMDGTVRIWDISSPLFPPHVPLTRKPTSTSAATATAMRLAKAPQLQHRPPPSNRREKDGSRVGPALFPPPATLAPSHSYTQGSAAARIEHAADVVSMSPRSLQPAITPSVHTAHQHVNYSSRWCVRTCASAMRQQTRPTTAHAHETHESLSDTRKDSAQCSPRLRPRVLQGEPRIIPEQQPSPSSSSPRRIYSSSSASRGRPAPTPKHPACDMSESSSHPATPRVAPRLANVWHRTAPTLYPPQQPSVHVHVQGPTS